MKKEDEKVDSVDLSAMKERAKKRERKKRREMDVSGKSVFRERELRIKNQELGEKEDDRKLDS